MNLHLLPQFPNNYAEPLKQIETLFLQQCEAIKHWFEKEWQLTPAPVYGSIDLRNAGFKIAPVDMNLFPAGFNNLNPDLLKISVDAAKKIIDTLVPGAQSILVLAESHTRNIYYWESINALLNILTQAGFRVKISVFDENLQENKKVSLQSSQEIVIEKLYREGNKIKLNDFCPDFILLNNDLSEGKPDILKNIIQPILPPAELGWYQRLKSDYFQFYAEVAEAFSKWMQFDPWLISPLFRYCGAIDFVQQGGLDCVISNANILFDQIQKKYDEYGIKHQPFLVVKADAGTYGMAVMTVRNIDELHHLNRKQRNKMASIKGGRAVKSVIIQEGIYTFETYGEDKAVAEPVVYLWGENVVGGFYRVHKGRGVDENLNSPGMHFEPLPFAHSCDEPNGHVHSYQKHFYLYGIISQLGMLAAARELKKDRS